MSEEKVETTEITQYEEWEVNEILDDWVAEGSIDAYVYSFKQGGKQIVDLTARAYEHLAKDIKISRTIDEVVDSEDGVMVSVTATEKIIHPQVTETKPDGTTVVTEAYTEEITAPGLFYSPKKVGTRLDAYAHAKALTKADRNAIRRLVPIPARKKAIETLLQLQGGEPVNVTPDMLPDRQKSQGQGQQKKTSEQNTKEATETAMKECFAVWAEQKDEIVSRGLSDEEFWTGVRNFCKVESRNEMTLKQWKMLSGQLRQFDEATETDYGEIVIDIINSYTERDASDEVPL